MLPDKAASPYPQTRSGSSQLTPGKQVPAQRSTPPRTPGAESEWVGVGMLPPERLHHPGLQ